MLKKLYINNFATVDSLILEFGQNLNILSGETGAGKSIIIESVNFLFGKTKNVGNIIRTGEKEAFISCVFNTGGEEKYKIINAILEECGIGTNDDEVLIKRTVNLSGILISEAFPSVCGSVIYPVNAETAAVCTEIR